MGELIQVLGFLMNKSRIAITKSKLEGNARFYHERPQDSGPEGHCT